LLRSDEFLAGGRCRAEKHVDGLFAAEQERKCRTCGGTLPPQFFPPLGGDNQQCSTCKAVYDKERVAVLRLAQPPAEKQCRRCQATLPAAAFYPIRQNITGLSSYCRVCNGTTARESQALTASVPVPENAQPATKACSKCGVEQPRSAFSSVARYSDGLQSWCRGCVSDYDAKRRAVAAATATSMLNADEDRSAPDCCCRASKAHVGAVSHSCPWALCLYVLLASVALRLHWRFTVTACKARC